MKFKVISSFEPMGDQIDAIETLSSNLEKNRFQTLLGVTGSGKTFTVAKVIEKVQKPTLVLAHNKTLAAQLVSEFREFFPNNAVEFFVSYYDYYQPEAYVPGRDLYIEKESSVNDEIDKLRHSATASLQERKDVIIVASVSCIYGLGSPVDYKNSTLSVRNEMHIKRDDILKRLISMQYKRNDIDFKRATFRVRGDAVEIIPANKQENSYRIEMFGDEIDRIIELKVLTGEIVGTREHLVVFPASHYATDEENIKRTIKEIEEELEERLEFFNMRGMLLEAQRIEQRTRYDIEMLKIMGFCSGIENYSRILVNRKPGERPLTLFDYFPKDFLLVVDESHVSLPQVRGMYGGDRSRKENLVEHGFRLPSALDNRPMNFDEFISVTPRAIFVSATPGPFENENSTNTAQQIIRPTGLIDPNIEIRPVKGQMEDLYSSIINTVEKGNRVLITVLTKRMAEDLTRFLDSMDIKVNYMHSDIDTLERMSIIRSLRLGEFDVLVGINLLREGLDIPEVALIAILDADKEGFLRSRTSLIQTIGRAARNIDGRVIMYADKITPSMKEAIDETNRRRNIQEKYNKDNNITPKSIKKRVMEIIEATKKDNKSTSYKELIKEDNKNMRIDELEKAMFKASNEQDYEAAIFYRDAIKELKGEL